MSTHLKNKLYPRKEYCRIMEKKDHEVGSVISIPSNLVTGSC